MLDMGIRVLSDNNIICISIKVFHTLTLQNMKKMLV